MEAFKPFELYEPTPPVMPARLIKLRAGALKAKTGNGRVRVGKAQPVRDPEAAWLTAAALLNSARFADCEALLARLRLHSEQERRAFNALLEEQKAMRQGEKTWAPEEYDAPGFWEQMRGFAWDNSYLQRRRDQVERVGEAIERVESAIRYRLTRGAVPVSKKARREAWGETLSEERERALLCFDELVRRAEKASKLEATRGSAGEERAINEAIAEKLVAFIPKGKRGNPTIESVFGAINERCGNEVTVRRMRQYFEGMGEMPSGRRPFEPDRSLVETVTRMVEAVWTLRRQRPELFDGARGVGVKGEGATEDEA